MGLVKMPEPMKLDSELEQSIFDCGVAYGRLQGSIEEGKRLVVAIIIFSILSVCFIIIK